MLQLTAQDGTKSSARVQRIAWPTGGKGTTQLGPRRWERHTTQFVCAFQASRDRRTVQIQQGVGADELVGDSMIC